ncbi:MAG: hypothetical protein MRJ92_10380 [Nitrospira sp.]|nr:hypothetical protein [Nitrospira sp.]
MTTDRHAARQKNVDSMEFAVDFMMQRQVDSYFRIEPALEEVERSLGQIEDELDRVRDVSGAARLESRLEFVEDRWDELDSEIRERPRRRRRKINLADFLKSTGGRQSRRHNQGSQQRVRRVPIAGTGIRHAALPMSPPRSATRQRVRPDARNGDRGSNRNSGAFSKPINF